MSQLAPTTVRPASELRDQLLAFLFQYRVADTEQLRVLAGGGVHLESVRRRLRALRSAGLVVRSLRPHQPSLWALSRSGRLTVGNWPLFAGSAPRRRSVGGGNLHRAHTLTVTRAAICFLEDARARGDEFSALDWMPEVAHPVNDGVQDGERRVIADALLRYTRVEPRRQLLRAFVEVDLGNMSSERLAAKTITYARMHTALPAPRRGNAGQRVPVWQRSYPVFPRVLFVLTGAGPRAMVQRIADLQAMVAHHPLVEEFASQVPLGAAVLEELEERGASAPAWTSLDARGERRSWMDL